MKMKLELHAVRGRVQRKLYCKGIQKAIWQHGPFCGMSHVRLFYSTVVIGTMKIYVFIFSVFGGIAMD